MYFERAINALVPTAEYSIVSDGDPTYADLEWLGGGTKPTEAELTAKIAELQSAEPLRLLRIERDRLIAETDWWASSDLTMTAEQTAYRQALRDITETYTSLDDVVWPTKPE